MAPEQILALCHMFTEEFMRQMGKPTPAAQLEYNKRLSEAADAMQRLHSARLAVEMEVWAKRTLGG